MRGELSIRTSITAQRARSRQAEPRCLIECASLHRVALHVQRGGNAAGRVFIFGQRGGVNLAWP